MSATVAKKKRKKLQRRILWCKTASVWRYASSMYRCMGIYIQINMLFFTKKGMFICIKMCIFYRRYLDTDKHADMHLLDTDKHVVLHLRIRLWKFAHFVSSKYIYPRRAEEGRADASLFSSNIFWLSAAFLVLIFDKAL